MADQPNPDGFGNQNDIERRGNYCRWSVGVAGDRVVGADLELSAFPLADRSGLAERAIVARAGPFCSAGRSGTLLIRYFLSQQRTHRQGTISGLIRNSTIFCASERRKRLLKHVSQVFEKNISWFRRHYAIRHTSKSKHVPCQHDPVPSPSDTSEAEPEAPGGAGGGMRSSDLTPSKSAACQIAPCPAK